MRKAGTEGQVLKILQGFFFLVNKLCENAVRAEVNDTGV